MKYLKKFETEADVLIFDHPNVVLTGDTGSVLYNVASVAIQHVDGTLYTIDGWTAGGFTNDLANGVAVIDSACQFVIAKNLIAEEVRWGGADIAAGITTTTSQERAVEDFAGVTNTAVAGNYSYADDGINLCRNYTFPNGQKGYMPALGEWLVARENKTAIDSALNIIGGELLDGYCWSSTQYNTSRAWNLDLTSDVIRHSGKGELCKVRAFATLSL